jgi:hypothetical protein
MGWSEEMREGVGEVLLLLRSFSGSTREPESERYRPPPEENIVVVLAARA